MPWVDPLLCGIQFQDHEGVLGLLRTGTSANQEKSCAPIPLHVAIEQSDVRMVNILLESGADVNQQDSDGEGPLHCVTQDSVQYEVMERLLHAGADINCTNKWRRTPLHYCCYGGELNKIDLLLKVPGLQVNSQDEDGNTSLHALVTFCEGDPDDDAFWQRGLRMLLDANVDANITNQKGQTALHTAAAQEVMSNAALLPFLNQNANIDLEQQDTVGNNFLHTYIYFEPSEHILQDVLKRKCKICSLTRPGCIKSIINMENNKRETPFEMFLFGSSHCDLETLQCFVSAGADMNKPNNMGRTPLHRVMLKEVCGNRLRVCKILLDGGAEPNSQDIFGITPVFWLRTIKDANMICGGYGTDATHTDACGRNALMNSLRTGKPEVIKELTRRGCHINATDKHGSTALHYAVWLNDSCLMKELLQIGGDSFVADNDGQTPLKMAEKLGNWEISEILKKYQTTTCVERKDTTEHKEEVPVISQGDTSLEPHIEPEDSTERNEKGEVIYRGDTCLEAHTWRGSKHIVNHDVISNSMNIQDILGFQGDGMALAQDLFNRPGSGILFNTLETTQVTDSVQRLIQKVSKRLSQIDPRFTNEVFQMGSMREGTKTGYPEEFDFVCCLTRVPELCNIQTDNDNCPEGFVQLRLKPQVSVPTGLESFFDKDGCFKTYDVRMELFHLLWEMLMEKEQWADEGMIYVGDDRQDGFDDKPVLNFQVTWVGSLYKDLEISIDFVPAIHVPDKIPGLNIMETVPQAEHAVQAGFFLLLHSPSEIPETAKTIFEIGDNKVISRDIYHDEDNISLYQSFLRVSCAPIEVAFMDSLPKVIRDGYILADC